MKMASMKLPKRPKEKMGPVSVGMNEREEYPYGLRLSLNEDQIKKLDGLFDMDVEGDIILHARAKIVDKRSHEMKGGKTDRSMEIQITDLACRPTGGKGEEESDSGWYNKKKGR